MILRKTRSIIKAQLIETPKILHMSSGFIGLGFSIIFLLYPIYKASGNELICSAMKELISPNLLHLMFTYCFISFLAAKVVNKKSACPYLRDKAKNICKRLFGFTADLSATITGALFATLFFAFIATPQDQITPAVVLKAFLVMLVFIAMYYILIWTPSYYISTQRTPLTIKALFKKTLTQTVIFEALLAVLAIALFTSILMEDKALSGLMECQQALSQN
ncbi:hypothetical protein SAMN05216571_106134 [Onishia taeanensis]|uniref:Uncharacterized protein n=2 Tax=Onishia taeanensis TaxID=284577 RepID=A0A1G7SFE2_9GAMM|nr:hypothetical protein SAMN05216571_106134 [Halomonas taeanensis]